MHGKNAEEPDYIVDPASPTLIGTRREIAISGEENVPSENPYAGKNVSVCIGIFAWNEEKVIGSTLNSLFQQTIFQEFAARGLICDIVCVVNGCSDSTPVIARTIFAEQHRRHPSSAGFKARVAEIAAPGKLNAWNEFVHSISAQSAAYLVMMDADISLHRPDTLWRMVKELESVSAASVSVDTPRKDVAFKARRSPTDWLSLAMAKMTNAASGQLCGQLYCIRSEIARNMYLPKDLGACEDGFIKSIVCTDFLSRPVSPQRVVLTSGAEHTFEAYTTPRAIFRNQKRQMMGQTVVHILIDQYIPSLSRPDRRSLGQFLRKQDENEPGWLKGLIRDHLRRTKVWWRLYPGLMTQRFKNLRRLSVRKRLVCLPAAVASSVLALFTSYAAWKSLRGGTTSYWPKAPRSSNDGGEPTAGVSARTRDAAPLTNQ